jgi:hypothetical protein
MYAKDKAAFDSPLDAAAAVVALGEITGKISPVIKGFTQILKVCPGHFCVSHGPAVNCRTELAEC